MTPKVHFDHFNFNVFDLGKSLAFYEKSLGLTVKRRKEAEDGSFVLCFLGDETTGFRLELTWLRDRTEPYNLGDLEYHLCVKVESDYAAARAFHKEMGCVCYENESMGIYFINDPDGYWIEVVPNR